MAPRTTPGIGLASDYNLGENGWKEGMDANLLKLSIMVNARVEALVANLPGSPTEGSFYIVTSGANANRLALRDKNAWVFYTPRQGYRVFSVADQRTLVFTNAGWETEQSAGVPQLTVSAGSTANSLLLTLDPRLDLTDVELAWFTPVATNTGAVTAKVNGGPTIPVQDFAGNPLAAGYLVAGSPVLVRVSTGSVRLLFDQRFVTYAAAAEASRVAAEAARLGAENARDNAVSAKSNAEIILGLVQDARDVAVAARQSVETAQGVVLAARDVTLAARDVAVDAAEAAEDARDQAMSAADHQGFMMTSTSATIRNSVMLIDINNRMLE